MKILAVSDQEIPIIYSPSITERFKDIDLVIGCGDLPFYYLEYIISALNKPLYYVHGNHVSKLEIGENQQRAYPWGAINLQAHPQRDPSGLLLAGIEGSVNYNNGPYQYTQSEMWLMVYRMIPALLFNRLRYGRYLDIFVTHAPPWKIHDADDRPHTGIQAFRWFDHVFKPKYHLHGHIHILRQYHKAESLFEQTRILNACGYCTFDF
jgi:uncharacterized protein